MISTSTVLGQITSIGSDLGILMVAVIVLTFAGWVALTGLGFLKRKFGKYVSGKKF